MEEKGKWPHQCWFIELDAKGNIYIVTTDEKGVKLNKLSRLDGTVTWDYSLGGAWPLSLLIEADGTAYVSTRLSELHKVMPSGKMAWVMKYAPKPPKPYIDASFISLSSFGTILYAGTGDGVLRVIDTNKQPDKSIIWEIDLGDRVECIFVDRIGKIYVGCWHGVYAIDSKGKIIWFRETMGAVISLMLSGSTLYAGSRDGWIYSIKLGGDVILRKISR